MAAALNSDAGGKVGGGLAQRDQHHQQRDRRDARQRQQIRQVGQHCAQPSGSLRLKGGRPDDAAPVWQRGKTVTQLR